MEYKKLHDWIITHNAKERTERGFLEVLDNLKKDSPRLRIEEFGDNFNPSLLCVTFFKVALTVRVDLDSPFNYIASYARVEYDNEDKGVYKLIFNWNGEVEDDYWLSRDD